YYEIPVGIIEAKDIGDKDLEGAKKTGNKELYVFISVYHLRLL
ncbi:MAG: hypothetical protein ACI87N_001527, partial [Flavobacteriales bacterium]